MALLIWQVWHRIQDFQLVSLLEIAEGMLLGSPTYARVSHLDLILPGGHILKPVRTGSDLGGPWGPHT